jgi:NAD(P)-dependent dehydrogenase (short-subunit alcohol dehydrogenase family)
MTGLGLKGKRVIVTGAAGGLGRTFAVAFADAGARIVAADVNISGADDRGQRR